MRHKKALLVMLGLLAMALLVPTSAFAQDARSPAELSTELDNVWVIITAVLVIFMQAGFLFLEVGFSRGKNVGAGVAKVLINLSIATIAWWAVGYGIAFGTTGDPSSIIGTNGFFFSHNHQIAEGLAAPQDAAFMLFQFAFCAVSLAIVWGTTLERIKIGAYVIYAIVFSAIIYPLIAHAIFGGGLLSDIGGIPVMDFAGSTVVHLTGATGGLAALLLLGPRVGKYATDGAPRALPGHSMPIVGLGILILWVGWFGFNGGSTLGTSGVGFAEVCLNTQLAAAAGVLFAGLAVYLKTGTVDVGMCGNGAIAALVGITAPSGFVEFWAAPIIGAVAGVLVVFAVIGIEKYFDDPVGALSAHGLAGIWGTLSVGIFGSSRLILDGAKPGLVYGFGDGIQQLGVQALGVVLAFLVVFALSYATFFVIKATMGLRVSEEEELLGLDIAEHGMYGYPEQFIPQPEMGGAPPRTPHIAGTPVSTHSGSMTAAPNT